MSQQISWEITGKNKEQNQFSWDDSLKTDKPRCSRVLRWDVTRRGQTCPNTCFTGQSYCYECMGRPRIIQKIIDQLDNLQFD
jgi:hypothetical protein